MADRLVLPRGSLRRRDYRGPNESGLEQAPGRWRCETKTRSGLAAPRRRQAGEPRPKQKEGCRLGHGLRAAGADQRRHVVEVVLEKIVRDEIGGVAHDPGRRVVLEEELTVVGSGENVTLPVHRQL